MKFWCQEGRSKWDKLCEAFLEVVVCWIKFKATVLLGNMLQQAYMDAPFSFFQNGRLAEPFRDRVRDIVRVIELIDFFSLFSTWLGILG